MEKEASTLLSFLGSRRKRIRETRARFFVSEREKRKEAERKRRERNIHKKLKGEKEERRSKKNNNRDHYFLLMNFMERKKQVPFTFLGIAKEENSGNEGSLFLCIGKRETEVEREKKKKKRRAKQQHAAAHFFSPFSLFFPIAL